MIGNTQTIKDWRFFVWRTIWSAGITCVFGACGVGVNVQVKPLSPEIFPPMVEGKVLDEWNAPPKRPYRELAKLIATKAGDDEEMAVKQAVLVRARELGADAIIIVKTDVLEEMGHPRYNTASTLEGESGFLPGVGTSWFAEETSSDSIRFTYYLSAIAIKYQSENISRDGKSQKFPSTSHGDSDFPR